MKFAISSRDKALWASMDARFGRAEFFVITDTSLETYAFVINEPKYDDKSAGQKAAILLKEQGVEKVISGEFGDKAKMALKELGIMPYVYKGEKKSVKDILDEYGLIWKKEDSTGLPKK